ncbi:MAG: helix-hairpin-helix domain-containing protein [Balneolales bacterium]
MNIRSLFGFIFLFAWLLITIVPTSAQVSNSTAARFEVDLESLLEEFDEEESDINAEEYIQFLQDLLANPVNVNRASSGDLLQIPGMNPSVAREIILHRGDKPFEQVEEMLDVRGIGPVTLQQLRPFVTVGSGKELRRDLYTDPSYWFRDGRFEAITRYQQILEEQAGYQQTADTNRSRYLGSPVRYYQRLNYRSRHVSVNITQTKAPGEILRSPMSFDYNSGHFALQDNGRLKMLVLGDYGLYFAQGLVMWNGMSFGKGRETTRIRNNERGLRPYQSGGQTLAKRGAALTYGEKLQVTAFYSNRKLSSTPVKDDTVRYPGATGMHRTQNEVDRRFNTGLKTYGGRLRYQFTRGNIGVSGYYTQFDKYILAREAVYNRFDFEGKEAATVGIDYMYFTNDIVFFGEAAKSLNRGQGLLSGIEYSPGTIQLSMTYRNYAKDFQSLFGGGFGESSNLQNEEGLYFGIKKLITRGITLSGYFDQFRFKAPRFGTRRATQGYDWLGLAEYKISREMQVYLLVRNKERENDYETLGTAGKSVYASGYDRRGSIRIQLDHQVHPLLRSRTRVEWLRGKKAGEEAELGMLIFQDFRWNATKSLQLDGRIAVFDTESFTSKVFQFENDMLYVMSNSALFDRGQRTYLNMRYRMGRRVDIWVKYGVTVFENRLVVGSGLDESEGNTRSNVGMQMRVRF